MRSLVVLTLLLAACGTRTPLDEGDSPTVRDAGRDGSRPAPDGSLDAGRDAGRDAGPRGPACQSDAECRVGVCRGSTADATRDLAALRLFCGPAEAEPVGPPGSPCQERAACDRHLCTISGACVIPCRSQADCDDSDLCREAWVRTSERTMESLQACTARFAVPSSVTTSVREGPTLGDTTVPYSIPELRPNGLVVWVGPPTGEPIIGRIETRGTGETVYDLFALPEPGDPGPAWGVGPVTVQELVTLMIPNGPNTPRSRRGYNVLLTSTVPGPTDALILQRSDEGTSFDIDAYLVGGGGWRSSRGEVPAPLQRGLDDAETLLRGHGLSIGEVRVHEVVGGLRRRFEVLEGETGVIGAPPELPDLYRLSAGSNRPSIHIFFVRMIDGALGIASGIPGPHGMPGTGASGVAIAVDLLPDSDLLGKVLLHEIGHFMGLFHASEADGSINDPLTDTAECGPDHDTDGDGFVVPEECVGAGGDNVMFWTGLGGEVSRQQAELMRRAYFVQ